MEQKQLKEETELLPKQRIQTTKCIQCKAVMEQEIDNGLELTKDGTLKQFEESENETLANKRNLDEFKRTTKEHATDEEMLARDDEADSFQSFGSIADHHWRSIKTFSKPGSVQNIFNFFINDDLLSLKNDFLDMFYKQTSRFKINFSFGFILRNRIDGNFRYWHVSNGVDRILDQPQLISNFFDFEMVFEQSV